MNDFEVFDVLADQTKKEREQAVNTLMHIVDNELHNDLLKDVVNVVALIAKNGRIQGLKKALEGMTHYHAICRQDRDAAAYKGNNADRRTTEGKRTALEMGELADALGVVLDHLENRKK